jgi:hypothetical protein
MILGPLGHYFRSIFQVVEIPLLPEIIFRKIILSISKKQATVPFLKYLVIKLKVLVLKLLFINV